MAVEIDQKYAVPELPFDLSQHATLSTESSITPASDAAELAERLYLPIEVVEDMLWILRDKKSLILSGPPGAGKTYAARQIAAYWAQQNVDFIQFHPSYSYEYFVSGYRPDLDETHGLNYKLEAGPLLRICNNALKTSGDISSAHVLVIDEINRANVSSVFGEFLSGIENRDEPILLQYGNPNPAGAGLSTHFEVPSNVFFIATMNLADRSAGNFDAALRRRFGQYDCNPLRGGYKDVLRKYLEAKHPDSTWVADWIDDLNQAIPDPDYSLGGSYFFGRSELSSDTVARIFRFEIWPFLIGRFTAEQLDNVAVFDIDVVISTYGAVLAAPQSPIEDDGQPLE